MAESPTPIEIFCCYSRADEVWLRKLESHLNPLKRQGLISLWYDRLIIPGTNWADTIDQHLETASVILLLVSSDFLASDYCYSIEMKRALEREEAGEARVVPILVRPVDWKGAPFAHLQALPTDAKPIASWRDKDRALTDVAAGVRRVIEDVPLLAASAPRTVLPKIWNVPYSRNPFFLGRDTELALVRRHLQEDQATALSQPQAISGLGGIGKTQLALEYTYRYHQDYQAVLWTRAESTESLISSYIALATLLRLPEREAKEQEVTVQAVKTWLLTHRGWLLILDNADDLTLLPDFLPPSSAGHLLLTTRAAATGRLAHRLEIETLSTDLGALFLLRRAALVEPFATLEQASDQERELALQISRELGGLPLALDQAGAYLEETGMDLVSYQQIYQRHRTKVLQERRGLLVADHPSSVATTWSLSFQRVEDRNPAAAELLRLCAFLSPDAIPEEILTTGGEILGPVLAPVAADVFLLNQAIEALRAYSLVRRDPKGKTLSIHRMVQVVLQDQLSETERRSWAERAMLATNAAFPKSEYGTWPQCERLLPHALLAVHYIERDHFGSKEAGRLAYETASYLQDRGSYQEAEPLYQCALSIWEQYLGPSHPDVASLLNGLAYLYYQQVRYELAEPLYQRALSIWEQQLEPDHPDIVSLLNGVGCLYKAQGRYAEAEPFYLRALSIWEQHLGSDHPNVAFPLKNLAYLYYQQGKYEKVEPLYLRALSIWEQRLGANHSLAAPPFNGLANLYYQQGRYAEAEAFYQRALSIWEQYLGPDHSDVASALNGLANLYREQGRYGEAEPMYQRALHIREQALGSQHPETAETMHDLARLWEAQKQSEEAKTWYIRTLAIREQTLGAPHQKTTETRNHLIALLRAMGQHEEAAQLEATQSEL